jgi:hypothetical protein
MTQFARPLLYGMAFLVLFAVFSLQQFILPESYSGSTGWVGFGAIALGVFLTAESSSRATHMTAGATGVAGLSMPVVAMVYTVLVFGLWLLSPVLPVGIAIGLHFVLASTALFALGTWKLAEALITNEDAHQKAAGLGRQGILLAAQQAQRRLVSVEHAGVKQGMSQLLDDITYADRNGSESTAALEKQVVEAIDGLTEESDPEVLVGALGSIRDQLASRRDILKAEK